MSSEAQLVSFPADGHPDENQILLALERELPVEEAARVDQHLGTCWRCRARSEEMQRGILAFVEYHEKRYIPSLSTPPQDYSGFAARLRSVAGESQQTSLLAKLWRWISAPFVLPLQFRWASVVAAVMALVLFWVEVLHPPVVSANEFLTRAVAAQNATPPRQKGKPVRVARQKVQIRSEQQTVVREFEWVVGSPIPQSGWNRRAGPLQWDAPLTAEGFAGWRSSLKEKRDKVTQSGNRLTLETVTSDTSIRAASIVVQADTFHPVEQHLRFADDRQLHLVEIAFEISEPPQTTQPRPAVEMAQVPASKPGQPEPRQQVNLDEAELQLRYTLFTHQWDLDEDLVINRGLERVILSGVVSSLQREQEMRAALRGFSNVQLSIRAPENVPERSSSRNAPGSAGQTGSSAPLLKEELDAAFPAREERQAFIDRCLVSSDSELSHAWALKRLADRYDESAEQRLNQGSQAKLREMLGAHLQQLRRSHAALQSLLELLPDGREAVPVAPVGRRAAILFLFAQVQKQDALVAKLVIGTRADDQDRATTASFRLTHQSIEAALRGGLRSLMPNGAP